MHAYRFSIVGPDGSREIAQALVCPDVDYAATRWSVSGRVERCAGSTSLWRSLRNELPPDVRQGRLPQVCAIRLLLAGSRFSAVEIEYLGQVSLDVPERNSSSWLDRRLIRDATT